LLDLIKSQVLGEQIWELDRLDVEFVPEALSLPALVLSPCLLGERCAQGGAGAP
jgi:hypothetical protein